MIVVWMWKCVKACCVVPVSGIGGGGGYFLDVLMVLIYPRDINPGDGFDQLRDFVHDL